MQGRNPSARRCQRIAAYLFVGLMGLPTAVATEPPVAAPAASTAISAHAAAGTAPPTAPDASDLGAIASPLDLVETQIEVGEYDSAQAWLETHIRELESGPQRYDPALIRPLMLLGDAHQGEGEYAEALLQYQRATHLARVTAGLKSVEQIELVYREAAAYKALGAISDAGDREEYAFRILAQNTGSGHPDLLPAIYRMAAWHLETGNPFAARPLYEQALQIHDANGELDAPVTVPALQGLALTYRLERFPADPRARESSGAALTTSQVADQGLEQTIALNNFPAGEQALQQVVRIRQAGAAEAPMLLVEAVLDLADWYTLFDKPGRAEPLYAYAHELLSAIPDSDPIGYFATPRVLYLPAPGVPRGGRTDRGGEERAGFIELGYEISATGYVRNLTTLRAEPEGYMDLRARRSLRVARFRPALVDGVPIPSSNQTHRFDFTYRAKPEPAEAPADSESADEESADAESASAEPPRQPRAAAQVESPQPGTEVAQP